MHLYRQITFLELLFCSFHPGKRESRRFNGLYTLTQQDVINQST
ncbi:FAD-dependent oxidoreductase, partial [Bacteroides cellulosilyticus]